MERDEKEAVMTPEDLLAMRQDVELLTPLYSASLVTDPRIHNGDLALCELEQEGDEWFANIIIGGELYMLPVRQGEPDGDLAEVAPGVVTLANLRHYGLRKLGPGVWEVQPSLYVPGRLHAFVVICDVPEPAPFEKPLLFSPDGGRLVR